MNKALYILAELSDRDFDWLVHAGRKRQLPANTILIHEGEASDALYIVLAGTLVVSAAVLDGEEVARLSAGEVVGEMSFVDARLPSATVTAIEDTTIWVIPRVQLNTKLSHDVGFSSNFYRALAILLSDRLRSTVSRLGKSRVRELNREIELNDDLNPRFLESIDIAKVRLAWLLDRLRESQ